MKKALCAVLALTVAAAGAFAAGKKDSAEKLTIGLLNGPSCIPAAHLVDTMTVLDGAQVSYETFAAANQLLPKLISGEVDIGFLPPNVAAKTFTSGNGAVVNIGVSGNGMLSLITKDETVRSLADLRGKRVSVAGAGATPEYVFRYILAKNGIGEGEVELDFSIANNEIAAALISGKIDYAVVPEPFSTVAVMQDSSVRRAIDLQEEFGKANGESDYPMTLIVANADFAKKHPSLVRSFVKQYKASQEWTKKNPQEAGAAVESAGLGLKAAVVARAIPSANFTFEKPAASRKRVEALLSLFLSFAPESIGGALPSDAFYFAE